MRVSLFRSALAMLVIAATLMFTFSAPIPAFAQDKPDYQKHIDWSASDTGAPDCPWLYDRTEL
jgi:hypothetical protein